MVVLNAQNVKSESDIQGDISPLAGRYHVVVTKVDDSVVHTDKYVFDFRVLAGTMPGQEGCIAKAFFAPSENDIPKLCRLALAVGLLRPGETQVDVDFQDAVGRQLIIGVEEYTSKKGNKGASIGSFGMDTWGLWNPDVADVPKDSRALQYAQQHGQAAAQAAPPAAAPQAPVLPAAPAVPPAAPSPPAFVPPPPAPAGTDPWANV